jgi:hypothetical protein
MRGCCLPRRSVGDNRTKAGRGGRRGGREVFMLDETVFRVTISRYHANLSSDPVFFRRRCNDSTFQRITTAKLRRDPIFLRYSSLLGQCLRLISCATRVLPNLRLRAFRRRSSLPSLCYPAAGNSVAAHETLAANDYARGGAKHSRLLDVLSLTKRR